MAKIKSKKQFRLYDIYRCVCTNEMSNIEGIEYYRINRDITVITIKFDDEYAPSEYIAKNEDELKEIIREVNRKLNNCYKPGPKRRRKPICV